MRAHADRTDARAATAVRDAERLVQVQVRHVGAELAGPRDADERVEVRAVEVHLAAVLVHDRADLADLLLEHAVRRRVRHHQRAELGRRARRPSRLRSSRSTLPWSSHSTTTTRMPAIAADAAFVPCADAGIRHTSRAGLAACSVVLADREQARVLALRAGVRLQRHRVVAGDLGEPALEIVEQLEVALRLVDRRERMDARRTRAT